LPQDWREAKPYLKRNKDIVRGTELLLATLAEASEQHRSGTWSTVRFARKQGRAIWLIQPDGVIREPAKSRAIST
jgi:predicted Rossmann fold nucleotide-binding protein DprA/Smf involved in DNA uptake